MKDPRLLASVALFRELYDSDKDIYDVISEFIRAAILLRSKWTFNAIECTEDLKEIFGFQIPEAVIKTCLRSRLKKTGELSLSHGTYSVTDKLDRSKSIQGEFDSTKDEYHEILSNLVKHVISRTSVDIDEEKLKSAFNDYLLNDKAPNEFVEHISHFLINNQSQEGFRHKLNRIEEGLILYSGIKYSSDPSKLGSWNGQITIFLDTEHLFNATGLNGILHKQVFDDFNSLVKEVNSNKRKGSITLRYFEEAESDVDKFFYAAEKILENKRSADPSKPAMISILNGCKNKSEVVSKKANFFSELKKLKINIEEPRDYYEPEYIVEGQGIIEDLENTLNHKNQDSPYAGILNKFTKINHLRLGKNNYGIEKISAIFMTENRLTQAVAFSSLVRPSEGGIPFATNIEFMTERLWFKLNKGFSDNKNLPVSFDIITKAKLVLSSQLNNVVSEAYKCLKKQHDAGEISDEEAVFIVSELRGKPSKPEDFTPETLDDSIKFINSSSIESTLREKSLLEQKSKDGDAAVKQLREYKYKSKVEANKPHKMRSRLLYCFLQAFTFMGIPMVLIKLIIDAKSSNDTTLSIIFGMVGIIGIVVSFTNVRKINKSLWRLSKFLYKKHIGKSLAGK